MLQFLFQKKLPFAIWSLPGESRWQGIAQNNHEVDLIDINDISNAEGFVVAPFELTDNVNLIRSDIEFDSENFSLDVETEESIQNLQLEIVKDELPIIDRKTYLESCKILIDTIKKGKVEKVVLSRLKSIPFDNKKLFKFFEALLEEHKNAMVFIYSIGNGVWIGASPEIFIEIKENRFKTMALAGSKSIMDDSEWGSKEIEEQLYVTKYIQQKFKNIGVSFKQSDLNTIEAGPVTHLQSIFTGKMANHQFSSCIKQLHPTPAVCGIPKEAALESIGEIETHSRNDYTGFFGPVKKGDLNLFVNLRSALLTNQEMVLFLGGGITADSNPEKEWDETELKAQTLLNCYKNC